MRVIRSRRWVLGAGLGAATMHGPRSVRGQGPLPIRLGIHAQTSWLMYAARELGLFEKAGLQPTFIKFTVGTAAIPAVHSRSVDIVCPGITPFVAGLSQGVNWKIIGIDTELPGAEGFVARKDTDIKSVADFRGKRVAVAKGSTSDYGLAAALRKRNVPRSEVTILYMTPPQQLAAMLNNDIDGAAVWEPWMEKFSEQGNGRVIGFEADEGIYTAVAVYAADSQWLSENGEAARRFLRALVMAYDHIQEKGPQVAFRGVAESMGVPEDVVARIYRKAQAPNVYRWDDPSYQFSVVGGAPFAKNAADMVEFMAQEGIIPKPIDLAPAFDPSIIREVLKQRGSK